MISIERARQQASDLIDSGDPGRTVMVMTTPFKLGLLNLYLTMYADAIKPHDPNDSLMKQLREIQEDLQKVVTQILQQEYPPS